MRPASLGSMGWPCAGYQFAHAFKPKRPKLALVAKMQSVMPDRTAASPFSVNRVR
jgi:hypothetical protein